MNIGRPAAMLVIEMQNALCAPALVNESGLHGALARAVAKRGVLEKLPPLLDACRANGIAVIYLTKERHPAIPRPDHVPIYRGAASTPVLAHGTHGAQVVDEVKPQPGDVVLPRYTSIDPSYGSELWATLERLKARTLIVAGISTTLAVEGTVRAAANRSFHVIVAEDCCASAPEEWHRFSADNILPLLADVTQSDDIVRALA